MSRLAWVFPLLLCLLALSQCPSALAFNAKSSAMFLEAQKYQKSGQLAKAIELLSKSLQEDHLEPEIYSELAINCMAAKAVEPAIDSFRMAVGLDASKKDWPSKTKKIMLEEEISGRKKMMKWMQEGGYSGFKEREGKKLQKREDEKNIKEQKPKRQQGLEDVDPAEKERLEAGKLDEDMMSLLLGKGKQAKKEAEKIPKTAPSAPPTTPTEKKVDKIQTASPSKQEVPKSASSRQDQVTPKGTKTHKSVSVTADASHLGELVWGYNKATKDINDGRLDEGIAKIEDLVKVMDSFHPAFSLLAVAYLRKGNFEKALSNINKAISLDDTQAPYYLNRAELYQKFGKGQTELEQTVKDYRMAIHLDPKQETAFVNLAVLVVKLGNPNDGIALLKQGIAANPKSEKLWLYLSAVYSETGNVAKSLEAMNELTQVAPTNANYFHQKALYEKEMGMLLQAQASLFKAIELNPKMAEPYYSLGVLYEITGNLNHAIKFYVIAYDLNPDIKEAFVNMFQCMERTCNWTNRETNFKILTDTARSQLRAGLSPALPPFHCLSYDVDPSLFLDISVKYAEKIVESVAPFEASVKPKLTYQKVDRKKGKGKIKIGYVSSDFRDTNVARDLIGFFSVHNKEKFDVYAYSISDDDGTNWRKIMQKDAPHWVDLHHLSVAQSALKVNEDGIHVLVNLNGYTKYSKNPMFALRPAPIQILFKGYAGTLGSNFMDYVVGDRICTPPSISKYFTEQYLVMPNCYTPNSHKQTYPQVLNDTLVSKYLKNKKRFGLPENKFIFCNFNHLVKLGPKIWATWMNILKKCPNSVFWLVRLPKEAEPNLRAEAIRHGVDPKRLIFSDLFPIEEHLLVKANADLFLDTPIFTAHGTAAETLWAGIPVLTIKGRLMQSRIAASMLTNLGVPELITTSLEEYEEKAIYYYNNPQAVVEIKNKIKSLRTTAPLFDMVGWVRDWERAVEIIYDRWVAGLPPNATYVPQST